MLYTPNRAKWHVACRIGFLRITTVPIVRENIYWMFTQKKKKKKKKKECKCHFSVHKDCRNIYKRDVD